MKPFNRSRKYIIRMETGSQNMFGVFDSREDAVDWAKRELELNMEEDYVIEELHIV